MLDTLFDVRDIGHEELFQFSEPWRWIEHLSSYLKNVSQTKNVQKIYPGVSFFSQQGPIIVEDGATIQSGAVIYGPSYIATGVRIGHHALVRGNCLLLRGSVLGHATEVKRSIFFPGAKAAHRNFVGDSIIGRNVNLGNGVACANQLIDPLPSRTVHVEWNGRVVDTGLVKFGACIGDETRIGCNCVLNPGTILGKGCRVYGVIGLHGTFGAHMRIRSEKNIKVTEQLDPLTIREE